MDLHEAVRTIFAYVAKNYGPACSHCKTFYAEQGSSFCDACADDANEVEARG
jgi:hypothetical protein